MKPVPPIERRVQRAILRDLALLMPAVLIAHVPNGANLKGTAGPLLGDGMRPGFPDLIAYWNYGHALLEVKRPGYAPSAVSKPQGAMHARLAECGYIVAIVTSTAEAWEHLANRGAPFVGRPV